MQKKEVVVIGIGRFSLFLIEKLKTVPKYSIIAIDNDQAKLEQLNGIKNLIVGDATNEDWIKSIGIDNADFFIIGVGSDFQSSSIIAANIKQNFNGIIIAKSVNQQHKMILEKIGIEDVITPEIAAAKSVFNKIVNPLAIKDEESYKMIELNEGISVVKTPIISKWENKMVKDIQWPSGLAISLIYNKDSKKTRVVSGDTLIKKNDILAVIGENKTIISLLEKVNKENESIEKQKNK